MNIGLMNMVAAAYSRLEKEKLLSQETDTRFLRWALDPMVTFGVTWPEYKESVFSKRSAVSQWWDEGDVLLRALSERRKTGNAAINAVKEYLLKTPSTADAMWFVRVLNKDLRAGVQLSTLKKVFPGLVSPFEVALALPYDPAKHDLSSGTWYAEPKLDGIRMAVLRGKAYTRNGKELSSVQHLVDALPRRASKFVLDGEVMGAGLFDETSGTARRKTEKASGLTFQVFDIVRLDEWDAKSTRPLRERKHDLTMLHSWIQECNASAQLMGCVPFCEADLSNIQELHTLNKRNGFEGTMLKNAEAPYRFKRSADLLKLKDFDTVDLRIVECFEGKGKHKGRLGGFVVKDEHGIQTRVGSGFTDVQRQQLWLQDDALIGRVVEVQYQNKTPDGVLRFPVFVRFRPDKD